MPKQLSNKKILDDIKRVAKDLGKDTCTFAEYEKKGLHFGTVRKRFKSWNKALKKAGLKVMMVKNLDISDDEMIQDLQRVAKKLKKNSFTRIEYQTHGRISRTAVADRFKSWNKALKKAGLKPVLEPHRNQSDEQLIADLQKVARMLKMFYIPAKLYEKFGKYGINTLVRRFRSWPRALSVAGLSPGIVLETDFVNTCKTHEAVKAIVKAFNGNEADIVNVLAVITSGKWSRKKMTKWLFKPKMTKWIGEFKKPSLQPRAILEASFTLLPYDKNNVIRKLLLDRLITWADQERGANPTKARKAKVIKLLEGYVHELLAQAA